MKKGKTSKENVFDNIFDIMHVGNIVRVFGVEFQLLEEETCTRTETNHFDGIISGDLFPEKAYRWRNWWDLQVSSKG